VALLQQNRAEEALVALDHVFELFPGQTDIRMYRGEAMKRLGRLDDAIDLLEAYRQSVAENQQTLLLLASSYYERALRDQETRPAAALEDAGAALVCYERLLAIGAMPNAAWIHERIEQLGHWVRWRKVGAAPGLPPEPDPPPSGSETGGGRR
jgi:tetratricopeptide (TPR) repeat protein